MIRALAAAGLCWLAFGCDERQTQPAPPVAVAPVRTAPVRVEPTTPAPAPKVAPTPAPEYRAGDADGKLHVWFFDVGQGDAILIQGPTGKTVLIDGGPDEAGAHLSYRLPDLLHGPLDLVISTHPDPDHLGGLLRALSAVGAQRFVNVGLNAQTPQTLALMHWLHEREIPVFQPSVPPERRGEPFRIALGGGADLQVLWPRRPAEALLESDRPLQANSLVARLVYKDTAILFAADMTAETERRLLDEGFPLRSTLLKVSLHGGEGATTAAFLAAVKPEAAVISVGAGNREGFPSRTILERLEAAGAQVFRTDLDGEVRADSDGSALVVITERPAAGEAPETPHLFGARDTESGEQLAQTTVEAVRRRRPRAARVQEVQHATATPDTGSFGKVIEVRPEPKPARTTRTAQTARTARIDEGSGGPFVASRNSEVFHVPSCPWAKRIKKKNLLTFATRSAALQSGRRPAGDCHP